jgi:hypothetical protein
VNSRWFGGGRGQRLAAAFTDSQKSAFPTSSGPDSVSFTTLNIVIHNFSPPSTVSWQSVGLITLIIPQARLQYMALQVIRKSAVRSCIGAHHVTLRRFLFAQTGDALDRGCCRSPFALAGFGGGIAVPTRGGGFLGPAPAPTAVPCVRSGALALRGLLFCSVWHPGRPRVVCGGSRRGRGKGALARPML